MLAEPGGFTPPPYPYDRLNRLKVHGEAMPGGLVNLSIGAPSDPAPKFFRKVLAEPGPEIGYPPSLGTPEFRGAANQWLARRFNIEVPAGHTAACVGSKEFVASVPHLLKLRSPSKDTVLYPAVSYPTYAMGAQLHGCRAVPVPVDDQWRLRLDQIGRADIDRALCLWVNSPGNPAGGLDDLGAASRWGRAHQVPVISDECYIEFTWTDPYGADQTLPTPGRSILEHGTDGVIAVHSMSKRSNLAGARIGFYAGDGDLVQYLANTRKHQGLLIPGPVQAAAVAIFSDDAHVDQQRQRYRERLLFFAEALRRTGLTVNMPGGGFYLWIAAPNGDAWALAELLAKQAGIVVSPGEFYGSAGAGHIRVAVVAPMDRLELAASRLDGFGI